MFNAKSLTPEQVETIKGWAAKGAQISDVQKKLKEELDISITYMDARFLILDLNIELKSEEVEEVVEEVKAEKIATGEVHVSVDSIVRAGAAISGHVEFSDGEKALWSIDSMGRLNLDADEPGYKPSEEDLLAFQEKLRGQLQGMQ